MAVNDVIQSYLIIKIATLRLDAYIDRWSLLHNHAMSYYINLQLIEPAQFINKVTLIYFKIRMGGRTLTSQPS